MAKNMRSKICWTIGTFLLAFVMLFSTGTLDFFKVSADANQTIADGTYYVKNKEANRYMQLDDGDGSGYNDDGVFMELWSYGGIEDQRWTFTYLNNGYYKIISKRSGKALSVKSGKENADDTALIQETYTGNYRQQWNAELNSSGSYSFRCRASDPYRTTNDWAMSAGDGIIGNGLNVEQKKRSVDNDYKDEWILEPIKSQAIVIIPGIMCSELANSNNELVWINIVTEIIPTLKKVDQLACDENGNSLYSIYSFNDDDSGTLNNYKDLYDNLVEFFGGLYDVIFFDYDWRLSCANAAYELENLLSEYSSCVLVAHSMGGVVASAYLARSAANRAKTKKLITVGAPYTGSIKALQVIETGEIIQLSQIVLDLKSYAQNIPAVYELLPNQRYFVKNDSYIIDTSDNSILGYDSCNNYVKGLDWALKSNGQIKPMFQQAESFHNSLYVNGTYVTDLVDTYKIYGYGQNTPSHALYYGINEYEGFALGADGDGTVLVSSALNNSAEGSAKTYKFQLNHLDLIKDTSTIVLIRQIINGTALTYQNLTGSDGISVSSSENLKTSIVVKNMTSPTIKTSEGYEIYAEGDKLYYDDANGETHKVGTIWRYADDFCQYILYNDEYNIENMSVTGKSPLIRVDYYSGAILSETLRFNDISDSCNIHIKERTLLSAISNDITVYKGVVSK